MILGQSAATAASLAIDANQSVQDVPYAKLKEQLLKDGQILEYTPPVGSKSSPPRGLGVSSKSLAGVVIDDDEATLTGEWAMSQSTGKFVGQGYRHDNDYRDGRLTAKFETQLPKTGIYEVRMSYSHNPNRATNVPVKVTHAKGLETVQVNERLSPGVEGLFVSLGKFEFIQGQAAIVEVSNVKTDGHVIVDAVQWVPVK